MTAPLTILDRMTALYGELLASASDAEQDAIIDSGLEDAIANAWSAVRNIPVRGTSSDGPVDAQARRDYLSHGVAL